MAPRLKPINPSFSCGPTAKHPGWRLHSWEHALVSRAHRSTVAADQIEQLAFSLKKTLEIPTDYHLALLPGSATGAMSTALWHFLGTRGVDIWVADLFSERWKEDIEEQLKLGDHRTFSAPFSSLPDLTQADFNRDQVFVWTGTTSGVSLQKKEWIPPKRVGLTICDATSAVFCCPLPWRLLDVTAFSLQKGLGGEPGLGVLVLSPKAFVHLRAYDPVWPIPRTMSLKWNGSIRHSLFERSVPLNSISTLMTYDALLALRWIDSQGGVQAMYDRVQKNRDTVSCFVQKSRCLSFCVEDSNIRSDNVCVLRGIHSFFSNLSEDQQWFFLEELALFLENEKVAYDILGHRMSPPVLRFWCGPTVDAADLKQMLAWIAFSFDYMAGKWQNENKILGADKSWVVAQ